MSPRVLLASFLLMVTLSIVAAGLVMFPPPGPPVPEPLLRGFDPARVKMLRVERGSANEYVFHADDGTWVCQSNDQVRWPANEVRVRGGLRLLADATLARGAAPDSEPSTRLHITLDGTTTLAVFMYGGAVAGQTPVMVPGPSGSHAVGLTDDSLHAVFARSGLLPWRDDRAMPGVARDPTRLLIEAPAAPGSPRLELARSQGRWGLREPAMDRAQAATVQTSIDALARITIESFRDDANPTDLGLETPRVSLRVDGGRAADAYWWQLDIGGPASADGNRVFARMSGELGDRGPEYGAMGPVYGVIGLDALSGVFTNPEAYLARTSLATPVADIRRFSILTPDGARRWRYERTLDGWTVQSPTAESPRPATPAEAAAIPAILDLLAVTPAVSVALHDPAGFTPLARFDVDGTGDLPAESILIGQALPEQAQGAASHGSLVVMIQAGPSWRAYGPMPDHLAALLPVTTP